MGNDLKQNSCQIHTSQMYDYVFNEEEEMKKEDEKRKRISIFLIAK